MATPIPVAKPASSGTASIIGILLVLVLVGAEYYYLTTRDTQRQVAAYAAAHPEVAIKAKADSVARVAALKKLATKNGQQNGDATSAAPGAEGAAAGQPVPLDITSMMGGGDTDYVAEAFKYADEWTSLGAGLGIRGVVWLAALGFLFMMSPPAAKIGAARRVARNPKSIVMPLRIIWVILGFGLVALLGIGYTTGGLLTYGYPTVVVAVLGAGFVGGFLRASTKDAASRLLAEKIKRPGQYNIALPVQGGRYVNVPNPFRGTLVLGGAGAGKTYSIGEPFLEQFIQRGMAGIIYDFKFPVLAGAAQKALLYAQPEHQRLLELYEQSKKEGKRNKDGIFDGLAKPIRHRVINFVDMERTEKVNPLRPQDMPTVAYAMEYAQTILTNLSSSGAKGGDNFFTKSAQAYLTGIIWYYRNNYPALCTIPHAVATAVYKDFTHVLSMLRQDPSVAVLVQSLVTAVEQGAEKQIAGVVSSLQVDMSSLATAEISWVLAPDEDPSLGAESEGFSLNLNDPNNPTILTIGNDPTLAKTFSPVISCVVAVSLKLMNAQYKQASFVLIDEGATIYVPGLETIPATARSNRVAMLYMTQDLAQLEDAYGKDKSNVLVANLNNQFIGKVNSASTAKLVSDMIGREDVEMVSVNIGQSMGSTGSSSKGQSVSVQERQVFRTQDAYTLSQGEFVGQVVETDPNNFFLAKMEREVEPGSYPIAKFTFFSAEKGVVNGQMRAQLSKITTRDNAKVAAAKQALWDEFTAHTEQVIKQAEQEKKAVAVARGSRRGGVRPAIATTDGGEEESVASTLADTSTDILPNTSDESLANTSDESLANTLVKEGEGEHDWDARTLEHADAPADTEPLFSAAEQANLDAAAAQTKRERERLTIQPNAAAAAGEAEAQRQARRMKQSTRQASGSILQDMVMANHARIYREVEQVVRISGDNTLSKEALKAAASGQSRDSVAQKMQGDLPAKLEAPDGLK